MWILQHLNYWKNFYTQISLNAYWTRFISAFWEVTLTLILCLISTSTFTSLIISHNMPGHMRGSPQSDWENNNLNLIMDSVSHQRLNPAISQGSRKHYHRRKHYYVQLYHLQRTSFFDTANTNLLKEHESCFMKHYHWFAFPHALLPRGWWLT